MRKYFKPNKIFLHSGSDTELYARPGYKSARLMEMFGFSDPAASTIVNVNIYLRTIRMLCSNQNKYSNNIDVSFDKSFRKRTPHSIFYIRTINDINDYKMVS